MMHGFGWMFGGFFGLIFLVLIIWLIVWAVRRGAAPQGGCCGGPIEYRGRSALDIARERYARGEISKAEFDEITRNLK